MNIIEPPDFCPSCSSNLIWVNHILYCKNSACAAQTSKKVEHFAKTLKIKGLGPVSIKKLGLINISEIYELLEGDIAEALSSTRLAEKLFAEIENSIKASLNRLLPAFSIPLVGNTASEKLAKTCDSIKNISEDTCKEAGLGEKTTNNLLDWLEENVALIEILPFSFKFDRTKEVKNIGIVCISGRLKSFKTKAEAAITLKKLGYTVKTSLTKDVTILVNESGVSSAKTKTATQRGITIVENLLEFIGEI